MTDLEAFRAYVYSYPHKTAHRNLAPKVPLAEAWAGEDRSRLFLYLHVPYCEQRCGFCNLFTQVTDAAPDRYLDALERQARVMAAAIGPSSFARMAVGGGTPTLLSAHQLERLFAIAGILGCDAAHTPTSVECSPATASGDRLELLRRLGVARVSLGVQSFHSAETAAVQRRQDPAQVRDACQRIAALGFPRFNLDLITGLPRQDADSLRRSIDAAVASGANELYLYPLYVRPQTLSDGRGVVPGDRLALQRAGHEHLKQLGWRATSLRRFLAPGSGDDAGPVYRCQDDGMVGLGCGARSYTSRLHYSTPYAVEQGAIRRLVADWCATSDEDFAHARHGIRLDDTDLRRRWALLSLLDSGIDRIAYRSRFTGDVLDDIPELLPLVERGLVTATAERLELTTLGLEQSDAIGPGLFSPRVSTLMSQWSAE